MCAVRARVPQSREIRKLADRLERVGNLSVPSWSTRTRGDGARGIAEIEKSSRPQFMNRQQASLPCCERKQSSAVAAS